MLVLNWSLLGMEKRSLVFKFADRKSGEGESITEGRMGIYRYGLENRPSRRRTL